MAELEFGTVVQSTCGRDRYRVFVVVDIDFRDSVRPVVIAIEPMVNLGRPEVIERPDKWTVVTKDGSLSAHYEHTVAITENGPELLTKVN